MTVSSGQLAVRSKKTGLTRINRRVFVFICLLPTVLLPAVSVVETQEAGKVPLIGFLHLGSGGRVRLLREGLRELGYVDGQNIVIEVRPARGKRMVSSP